MTVARERPLWVRLVAVFFGVTAALAFVAAAREISETLAKPSYRLALYPRDMPPSSNIVLRNAHRWAFVAALLQVVLAPFFFIGGLLLFRYRDLGRRLVVWAFGLQTGVQGLVALLGVYAIFGSFRDPQVYPPLMGLVLLMATVAWGLVWFGLFTFFRSATARVVCGADPALRSEE